MKAFKGQSPITMRYWRRPIKSRPDLCRLMAVVYCRETQKRFYFNLPGFFEPSKLDKLDNCGRVINPKDYDIPTFNRIFKWGFYAAAGIVELEQSGVPVKEFTKKKLDEAINKSLREGGYELQ